MRDPRSPSPGSRKEGLWSVRPDGGASADGPSRVKSSSSDAPSTAYPSTTVRLAASDVAPWACSAWESNPPESDPSAVAKEPTSAYQEKTRVRSLAGMTWESAACSMARKGPTSFPAGLMIPMVAAKSSTQKDVVEAKRIPAKIIMAEPSRSILRRPIRSAWVVIQSESAVSPSSVKERSSPMRPSERPASDR